MVVDCTGPEETSYSRGVVMHALLKADDTTRFAWVCVLADQKPAAAMLWYFGQFLGDVQYTRRFTSAYPSMYW